MDDLKNIEDLGKISLEHVESECHEFHKKIEDLVTQFQVGKLSKEENLDPRDQIIKRSSLRLIGPKQKVNY